MSNKSLIGLVAVVFAGLAISGCNTTPQPAPDQITASLGVALEYNKICQTHDARKLPRCRRSDHYDRDAAMAAAAYGATAAGAGVSDLRVKADDLKAGSQQ